MQIELKRDSQTEMPVYHAFAVRTEPLVDGASPPVQGMLCDCRVRPSLQRWTEPRVDRRQLQPRPHGRPGRAGVIGRERRF